MRKSRKRKKKTNKDFEMVKKSIPKILAILVIVSLNWTGLSAVIETLAYFNDTETGSGNIYSAGTLDFSAKDLGDFSLNLNPNNQAVRNVIVGSEGSLGFKYLVEASDLEGGLCDYLNIVAMLEEDEKYNGSLVGLSSEIVEVVSSTYKKNWNFKISFSGDDALNLDGEVCQFNFHFKAWQTNMDEYNESVGFTDQEKVFTRVSLRVAQALAQDYVVLNEFLPNPFGNEISLKGIEGEWVELYNNYPDQSFDLSGWYIEDEAENQILITADNTYNNSSVIGAKGSGNEWLVVFMNGAVLNNGGDSVSLYNDSYQLIDSYSYSGSAPENKSYARYPDGTGPWYDPIPTPGGPNKIEETDFKEDASEGVGEQSAEPENDLSEISIIDTATPSDQEVIVEETIIEEEPTEEEITVEEDQEQGGIIEEINEEAPADEVLVVEEQPATEEQPAIVPDNDSGQPGDAGGDSENGAGEDGPPADTISE